MKRYTITVEVLTDLDLSPMSRTLTSAVLTAITRSGRRGGNTAVLEAVITAVSQDDERKTEEAGV